VRANHAWVLLKSGRRINLLGPTAAVIAERYRLPPWTAEAYAAHKYADRLAAASEAFHVVGWSLTEIRDYLEIELDPVRDDPVSPPAGRHPWEPWPPNLAAALFLDALKGLNSSPSR
jgi:5'-nucleotidase